MPNTILLKKNSTANATPTAAQLSAGELAINTADGRLFAKNSAGTVVNLPVSSISGQTVTPGKVSATSNATDPTTFSAGCRMLVYGDTFVGSSAVGVHTGVLAANIFDNSVDFAYMEALNCPPTQYKPLLFTTGYFPQLSLLPSRKIGVNTANPQADFQIVTGLDGVYNAELEEWNYSDTTSALAGAAQSEIFQVINGGYYFDATLDEYVQNEYVNFARFHCNSSYSRGSFSLSNSGTGAWENNVLQFFVHGSNYAPGYYGGNSSDAGAAMIVTQGSDITKLQIGNLGSVPIEFFTGNARRFRIRSADNSFDIYGNTGADYTPGPALVWNNTYDPEEDGTPLGTMASIQMITGSSADQGTLAFFTGAANAIAERVRIDQNGNVGIGTSGNAINAKLEVVGDVAVSGGINSPGDSLKPGITSPQTALFLWQNFR